MRGNSSMPERMINRNWVLKRKRKRISCGLDVSNVKEGISPESSRNDPSAKQMLKGDTTLSKSACKIKGNDGYYYECVECDLGGNLLCCDSCPRTYHLECLNPPLKRAPPGKWQCPNCCEQKDSVKLPSHANTVYKRARTKSTAEKSKTEIRLSVTDKASFDKGSSIVGKNMPFNKGKSILFHKSPNAGKKSDSFQVDTLGGTKSSNSCSGGNRDDILVPMDVKSSARNLDSDSSDKFPEVKSDISKNGSLGIKLIPSFCLSSQKAKKQRKKNKKGNKKKKSRVEKGKHVTVTLCNPSAKETSSCIEISGPRQKRSSINQQISAFTEEYPIIHKETQRPPKRISPPPHVIGKQGLEVNKKIKCDDILSNEVQQVDRILGCRVQSSDVISSKSCGPIKSTASLVHKELGCNMVRLASGLPSLDLIVANSPSELVEGTQAESRIIDAKDVEGVLDEEHHNDFANLLDERKMIEDSNAALEDHVNNTSQYIECVDEAEAIKLAKGSSKDPVLAEKNCRLLDESGYSAQIVEANVKNLSVENANVELVSAGIHGSHLTPEPCQLTVDSKGIDDVSTELQANDNAQIRIPKTTVTESIPIDGDDVMYEFLVKWVGQSNIHNSWVPESQLKVLAKRKLENYKAKYGTAAISICQDQWTQPQRVIALRVSKDGPKEAFIKWRGLPYDDCTWENLDESVIDKSVHLITEFNQFESQTLDMDAKDAFSRTKGDCQEIVPLVEQPRELKGGSLFPHQLEALNWLRKCWHKSKNVILADEMGLGKTVSACAFISSLYCEFKAKLPCLVLVPLSTMPNWLAEFALWAPHLNVVEYHGCAKARSIIRQYEWHASDPDGITKSAPYKFNVLLTTYEMVLADSSHLRGVPWEVLVVDEGHRLKNSGSKLFSLLNTFSFQHRVLLTGTPLQNNIGEMYNLLNFLQPVSFPSLSTFEEKFNDLTTAEKVEELKKLVAPHMLRRLKKDAMKNIPPKTERMVPVELTSIQAEYYRAMLTKNYQILRNIGRGGAHQSMLNIVMQLRKVCNHPYLIPGTEPESGSVEFLQEMRIKASAKLTLLHSMLKILHKEGHRVLIFSQMTKLLDILEDYLTIEFGPKTFERVDGSVSVADRQTAISRFNQDKTRFVFLLSTRSCGLGINLATADTVIIYDSDFNPHADIQAMNRAHRIGQSNRLLVYRLVVRASVEERILQLAKKKLMLDQLFVNKSESQKEVEDILRWGTEELFSDVDGIGAKDPSETCNNKADAVADGEQRHRRRAGGLGDVYQDRCTDGGNKIIWDESAILKLLDRSNLQTGASEGTDGDLENDMLGSVKSVEWNDDPNEEQGASELVPNLAGDGCMQTSETEEIVSFSTEENEWDRLLRLRWEKYQTEEEAALGRGKRLRKAVSYRESFAPIPSEALSESGNEEEEPEPEPEYTPAGRALKAKFAKLRARQKERLARRHIAEVPCSTGSQGGAEVVPQLFLPPSKEGEGQDDSKPVEAVRDQTSSSFLEENESSQPSEVLTSRSDTIPRLSRFSKHGYRSFQSTHLDLSVRPPGTLSPDIFLPSHQFQSTCFANSVSTSNKLPVLGLCAPNVNQLDTTHRNFQSFLSLPLSNYERRRTNMGLSEFSILPATIPGPSNYVNLNDRENTMTTSQFPEPFPEGFHCHAKNSIPDSYFPFNRCPPTAQGIGLDLEDKLGSSSAFQEKLALPNLALDEKTLPKFSFPAISLSKPHSDMLPSLSLDMKVENLNGPGQDLANLPMMPNFRQQLDENLKQKQVNELPPVLSLGQSQATHSLPENHRKVLDNIMMRTGSGTSKFLKKKLKVDAWSEDELDALWIGVRRHGRGNWDSMLRDPKLKFSRHTTSEDLSARWSEEQLKILDGSAFSVPKPSKSTFPGISDGMMTRALIGSRFAALRTDPPKFHSHLTDIQLGRADFAADVPCPEPTNHFGLVAESCTPLPPWQLEKHRSNFPGDFGAGASDKSGNLSLPLDQPFQRPCSDFNSSSMNCSSSSDLRENKDKQSANKYLKLPSLLDTSLNTVCGSQDNFPAGESNRGLAFDPSRRQVSVHLPEKDESTVGSSKMNKLPHWLREAVSLPSTKPPEPKLPVTVSAIAHSVRLLFGDEKPKIPPFTIPAPPPPLPKDPRKRLKRKRKLDRLRFMTTDVAGFSNNFDSAASITIPLLPPFNIASSSKKFDCATSISIPLLPPLNIADSSRNFDSPASSSISPLPPLNIASSSRNFDSGTSSSIPPLKLLNIASCSSKFDSTASSSIPSLPPVNIASSSRNFDSSTSSSFPPLPPLNIASSSKNFDSTASNSIPLLPHSSIASSLKNFDSTAPISIPPLPPLNIASSPKNFDNAASSSIPPLAPLTGPVSSPPWADPSSSLLSLNLNLMNSPSSSMHVNQGKKLGQALSSSPEVLHLVATCVAPGPPVSPTPGIPSSSDQMPEVPILKASETFEPAGKGMIRDVKGIRRKRKASQRSLLGCWGKLTGDRIERTESGDSSKTQSDPCRTDEIEVNETSSEETVSDDHQSEHE